MPEKLGGVKRGSWPKGRIPVVLDIQDVGKVGGSLRGGGGGEPGNASPWLVRNTG